VSKEDLVVDGTGDGPKLPELLDGLRPVDAAKGAIGALQLARLGAADAEALLRVINTLLDYWEEPSDDDVFSVRIFLALVHDSRLEFTVGEVSTDA
jgi:hypothetical protein